jgi:uncharacterized caspase-like protein
MNSQDHAVVVGIETYGSLKPLAAPVRDANAFRAWLLSPDGGHLPPENVALILSSDYKQHNTPTQNPLNFEPTLTRVTTAFAKLISLALKSTKSPRVGRRLYIYLSGHGITPQVDPTTSTNLSGLLMANYTADVAPDHISGQMYAEWFRLSDAFAEILLFMDCCRNDIDQPLTAVLPKHVPGGRVNEVKVFYAWATQWGSEAFEQPLGNPPEIRSVFTFALLEALTSGSPDAQGRLTPKSIVGHLALRIRQLQKGTQQPQFFPPDPDGRIVIAGKVGAPVARNVTITFAPALFGKQVDLLDGSFVALQAHTASAEPWPLALNPGTYVVHVDGRDTSLSVRPGETKEQHIG